MTIAIAGCNSGGTASLPATAGQTTAAANPVPEWQAKHLAQAACPAVGPGEAQCAALVMNEGVVPATAPAGWGPSVFEPFTNCRRRVRAKGNRRHRRRVRQSERRVRPSQYRTMSESRRRSSTSTINWEEQSHYPAGNAGWGFEIDLDVEMLSAAVQSARFIWSKRRTTACAISGEPSSERRNLARTSSAIVGAATRRVAPGRPAPSIGRT